MLNLYITLTLEEIRPESISKGRQIRGYFHFLTDPGVPVGPLIVTEPYDWDQWSQWLSHEIEERNLLQTGGMLHPGGSAELGPVHLRVPNRTPFFVASDDDEIVCE